MGDVDVADPQGSVPKPKRRWCRRRLRTVLATIVVLVVLNGLLIFHFRVHLVLRYAMAFGGLREAKAIPAGPMPEAPEPKDWVRCRFGSAEFSLPPKMAANVETTRNGAFRVFRDGSVSVMVDLPNDAVSMEKDLESATQNAAAGVRDVGSKTPLGLVPDKLRGFPLEHESGRSSLAHLVHCHEQSRPDHHRWMGGDDVRKRNGWDSADSSGSPFCLFRVAVQNQGGIWIHQLPGQVGRTGP